MCASLLLFPNVREREKEKKTTRESRGEKEGGRGKKGKVRGKYLVEVLRSFIV